MVQQDVPDTLLQRLLNRLDHIEYRLVPGSRDEATRDALSQFQRARLLEQQDQLIADIVASAPRQVPTVASHRGPGAYPALPRPLPAGHAAVASPDASQA